MSLTTISIPYIISACMIVFIDTILYLNNKRSNKGGIKLEIISAIFCSSMFIFASINHLSIISNSFVGTLLTTHESVTEALAVISCLLGTFSGLYIMITLILTVISILKDYFTEKDVVRINYNIIPSGVCCLLGCMIFFAFEKGMII